MNPDHFRESPAGRLVPTIQGCQAFVPNPLPPLAIDVAGLANLHGEAMRAIGELNGIARALPNANLLIRPFSRVEAVASSKIEGTVTSVAELLTLEVSEDPTKARSDTREVHNYTRALYHGLTRLNDLPLSKRLVCEMHSILLQDVAPDRGARVVPGELKKHQNWIGGRTIQNARFVPPPPDESLTALDDLEKFIHSKDNELPLLIKLALIHYQFEAIHPFPDGNGRLGRLIVPLMLFEREVMAQPLLYLSTHFEKYYDQYIDLMYDVSRKGDWNKWIEFFLMGVEITALGAALKAGELLRLYQEYMEKIREARSSVLLAQLVDSLFIAPATTIPHAMKVLGISYNSAKNNIQKLVELQIIVPDVRPTRPKWFFGLEIIDTVNA